MKSFLLHDPCRFLITWYPPDAGAGAGGSASTIDGAGSGAGSGGSAPFKLTDDALVDFGDGKPTKWGEGRTSRFMEKDAFDRGVKFLEGEATKLEQAWAKYHAGTGPKPAQQEPKDHFAGIRDAAVVDGRTLESVYQMLQKEGLGPIAQVVSQLAQQIKTLKEELGGVSKQTGALAGTRRDQDFESLITESVGKITGLKGLPDGVAIPADDPTVREIAKDVFLSHDQSSWKPGEFDKMLATRLEGLIALARTLDRKGVDVNKERVKKNFFNPQRGNGQGSGPAKFEYKRGTDMAAQMREAGMFR